MTHSDSKDIGFTHIALICSDADKTIDFYRRYGDFSVIHDRNDNGRRVFWLSDLRRGFAIVFLESTKLEEPLGPFGHLGVCLSSRALVDERLDQARSEGIAIEGPFDSGPPVGYWAFIKDPDGHTLELSFGQEIQLHVDKAHR